MRRWRPAVIVKTALTLLAAHSQADNAAAESAQEQLTKLRRRNDDLHCITDKMMNSPSVTRCSLTKLV